MAWQNTSDVTVPFRDLQGELDALHGDVILPAGEDEAARHLRCDDREICLVVAPSDFDGAELGECALHALGGLIALQLRGSRCPQA